MTPLCYSIISKCVSKKMTNIYIAGSSRQINLTSRLHIVAYVAETSHKTLVSLCLTGEFLFIYLFFMYIVA